MARADFTFAVRVAWWRRTTAYALLYASRVVALVSKTQALRIAITAADIYCRDMRLDPL